MLPCLYAACSNVYTTDIQHATCKLILKSICIYAVFIEQPSPASPAQIGTQVALNCSVIEGYHVVWQLSLPQTSVIVTTDQPQVLNGLRNRGIVERSAITTMSLLIINATKTNNNTAVRCIAVDRENPIMRNTSEEVQIFGML